MFYNCGTPYWRAHGLESNPVATGNCSTKLFAVKVQSNWVHKYFLALFGKEKIETEN